MKTDPAQHASGKAARAGTARPRRKPEQFLDELSALVMAEGISSLTIAEMAARLRCSRRRIYEIGATKEDVFLFVTKTIFDTLLAEGQAAARREDNPVDAVSAYLNMSASTSSRLSVAYLTDLDATPEARKLFDDYQTARAQGLEMLVAEGVEAGLFVPHNARLVSEALLGAALRIRRPGFLAGYGSSLDVAFAELFDLFLQGLFLRPQAGTDPARPREPRLAPLPADSAGEAKFRLIDKMTQR